MTKIAQVESKHDPKPDTAVAERSAGRPLEMARATAEALNARFQLVRSTADSAAEDWAESTRESVRKSVADITETGRMFLDLVAEQTQHGIDTANAFNGATNWSALAQAQSDFIAGSFVQINQINQHYRDLFWSGAKLMRSPEGVTP